MGKSVGVNKLSVVPPVLQPPVMGMGKDKDKSVCLVCEKEL